MRGRRPQLPHKRLPLSFSSLDVCDHWLMVVRFSLVISLFPLVVLLLLPLLLLLQLHSHMQPRGGAGLAGGTAAEMHQDRDTRQQKKNDDGSPRRPCPCITAPDKTMPPAYPPFALLKHAPPLPAAVHQRQDKTRRQQQRRQRPAPRSRASNT